MGAYLLKRVLLIVPTLFGIMLFSFIIIQFAPGGPVEQTIRQLTRPDAGGNTGVTGRISGGGEAGISSSAPSAGDASTLYRGSQGLPPELIEQIKKQYGFDRPAPERFYLMMTNYLTFNFGKSYFRDTSVLGLIKEKLPVSISLGLWLTILTYLVAIPLGIKKAVEDGERFDVWTSAALVIGHALPAFMVGVLLLLLFAGTTFVSWFPLGHLGSDNWDQLSWFGKAKDYLWHLTLPLAAMTFGTFTTTAFLTKNSFLDEIKKQYVITARSKGLSEPKVLYGHVFRNAMLLVISGFPGTFIRAFFTGSLLIETIFSLDGLGLLSFESIEKRDYPVVFATLYIFALMGLFVNILSDFIYTLVDPRIDFESREV